MIRRSSSFLLLLLLCLNAYAFQEPTSSYIMVLGTAQDGGYPHLGCQKICCQRAWERPTARRNVVSLALVDPIAGRWWLFEATPDVREQLQLFARQTRHKYAYLPEGIFITHAHIGHYAGLMQFGREVMGTKGLKVFVLPQLKNYLKQNGPWSQLIALGNIALIELRPDVSVSIGSNQVTPFTVPHRDEFSETAGFKISLAQKKFLFIPDIDKWSKWDRNIIEEVKSVDVAFLDATFNNIAELGNRPMTEIPHPLVSETITLFNREEKKEKKKIYFIHLNHTNPLLWNPSVRREFLKGDFRLAEQSQIFY